MNDLDEAFLYGAPDDVISEGITQEMAEFTEEEDDTPNTER